MAKRWCLLVIALMSQACGYNRVTLRAVPSKDAPIEERVAAAKDLLPESGMQTTYLKNGVVVGQHINHIMLGDGTRVEDPRDLLPAVEPGSATANYIVSYEDKVSTGKVWNWTSLGAMVVGAGLMVAPLAFRPENGSFFDGAGMPVFIAGGSVVLTGTILSLVAGFYYGSAQQDRVSAFETYPKAVVKRLDLRPEDEPKPKSKRAPEEVRLLNDAPVRLALLPAQ
ncbi:MAG: hypothetical protein K1X64_04045 [Myxococcaceae bacterium]|nr:hypothetical protein [Myxococcaceae bacterium]